MIAVHVRVSGRVQGVYYRAFTRERAMALGVKGWVRNVPGGGVEAVLEGERKQVGELLKSMKSGPTGSLVLGMELSELQAKGYEDFEIEY
ncbi:MAG: Acylphosphatase [Euryarchaeota archaeon ADurb.Bin190]|jgi:acylphosphatase|nr:MAG: Acylphosphatase [Euryarchaeota archaeon ADurb.Bin190]HNQ53921.1 acylphosphatase [Methanothrix sp.]HNU39794.1 acylphosphatase [Methanothrix sp.]HPA97382.1 acylphosphatase [Methanothrix sp.]HPH47973.1 acylphosphatase [Methanothrix sp.]